MASEAGTLGNSARARAKAAICLTLPGSSGISDETKWLISSAGPQVFAASSSANESPSRFMPVSTCSANGFVRSQRASSLGPPMTGATSACV